MGAWVRVGARLVLGLFLLYAGTAHLSFGRSEFSAQVPDGLPVSDDVVIGVSGLAEIGLGIGLVALGRYRVAIGWLAGVFFVLIFPGNVSQFVNRIDAFGLTSDTARAVRLLFQPVFVAWALWCTEAWAHRSWITRARGRSVPARRR